MFFRRDTVKAKTYIVRVWQEPSDTQKVWRASCTNASTNEKKHFATVDRLTQFLGEEFRQVAGDKQKLK
jgi:hypothetical protein